MKIRPYSSDDWPNVERIYAEGIATGLATFETEPKSQDNWESGSIQGSAIVLEGSNGASILGWAVLSPVSSRAAYAGVGEVSLYVGANARGHGAGKTLLTELITTSEAIGIWTLQAGIFEENTLSVSLHEKCGFRIVGTRKKIATLNGDWKNIILMERRSKLVGR